MSRYPYTEACDAIRTAGADMINGFPVSVSRSGASRIRQYIANVIGMDDEDLARRIADYARTQA
jgi:hypothetical protein